MDLEGRDLPRVNAMLSSFADRLDAVAGEEAWVKATSLLFLLRERLSSAGLANALLALTSAEIASLPSAYRHENGFLKIPLLSSARSGASLRLNVWSPELPSMENIHNHRWDFASWVVVGDLVERLFCEASDGELYEAYIYSSRANSDHYHLRKSGTRNIVAYNTAVIPSGAIYERHSSQLHQSFPSAGQVVITLQITHSPHRNWSSVFRRAGEPIPETYDAPTLNAQEVRAQFELFSRHTLS